MREDFMWMREHDSDEGDEVVTQTVVRDGKLVTEAIQPPATPQEPEQAQTLNDVFDVFETWARRKGATDTSSVSLGFWAFNEFHAIIGQPLRDWLLSRRASTPSPEGQTWQPIETAPKDTAVLLWLGWRFEIGHFNTALGRWAANWDHRALEVPATHWMPLPSPPTPGENR